jgi:hypothetical protein
MTDRYFNWIYKSYGNFFVGFVIPYLVLLFALSYGIYLVLLGEL